MTINERTDGSVTILDLDGRLTLGAGAGLLKDKVNSLILQGHRRLAVNLGGVTFIDSAGLGELVATYTSMKRGNGRIVLFNLTRRVHDLLAITKLLTVFDVFDSEAEAVKGLGTGG